MPIHGYPGGVITANPVAPTASVATGVWTTEQQLQATAAGNWPRPGPPQPISRSLRFNSADSAYLNRTPASTGSQTAWTWSGWVKRSTIETSREFIYAINNSNRISWSNSDSSQQLVFEVYNGGGADYFIQTTPVYRDPSAWYHIVAVWDSNNATAADRQRIYVNGVRITAFSGTGNSVPSGATSNNWNTTSANNIGRSPIAGEYFSGYLTELYFIDGQALTPSSFGQTNASTGVWEPIPYTGTYGTNGFYLNFSDNSNTTAATLGKDYSGNGNNWTPNNLSVTAGAGNDSLVDSPASYTPGDTGVGGEVRGNYATLNPLFNPTDTTLSNGNLKITTGSTDNGLCLATIGVYSGKWYWEVLLDEVSGDGTFIGITTAGIPILNYLGEFSGSYSYASFNGQKYNSGSGASYGATYATNDIVGVAFDADAGTLTFYKNGTSQGTAYSSIPAGTYFPGYSDASTTGTEQATFNFGQRPFAYTAPSGFSCLVTTNLPTPTIGATSTTQANKYMDVTLYTGNGAVRSITNSGSMQPDFVWNKLRSGANSHRLFDAVRGVEKALYSNLTNAETTETGTLTSFNSNGFSLGTNTETNTNGSTYVAWQWNAGGSTVTNTSGTISAQVRANTTSGFSIVTYTGTGVNATVGHGLGAVPGMIIAKRRSATQNWGVAHSALTGTQTLYLDLTQAVATGVWNGTPTSTVFNITTDGVVNTNGSTYVAYCFAPVAGYSAFGSYTGNGSTDGPFVYLGFRPAYVLLKASSTTSSWRAYDYKRLGYNLNDDPLFPNANSAEASEGGGIDLVSNGFKIRWSDSVINGSGSTYIYAAFAEFPFKYSLAE